METKSRKIDPLSLLPPIPINEIAKNERVSGNAIQNAIRRLGIDVLVTPTKRKTVSPADAVRLAADMRAKLNPQS
jgi:hypothetical protein